MNEDVFSITCKERELFESRTDIKSLLSSVQRLIVKYGNDFSLAEIKTKLEGEIQYINNQLLKEYKNDKGRIE